MIVGLRALLIMSKDSQMLDKLGADGNESVLAYKKTLRRRQNINVQLGPYMPHINSSVSYILLTLDNVYGNFTLLNQTKTNGDICQILKNLANFR